VTNDETLVDTREMTLSKLAGRSNSIEKMERKRRERGVFMQMYLVYGILLSPARRPMAKTADAANAMALLKK